MTAAVLGLLLRHDLRLAWRDARSNLRILGDRALAVLCLVLAAVMHAAAWRTGTALAAIGLADAAGRARVVQDLSPGFAFILLLMLAQVLSGMTRTLYGRGDLDLLFSSPFPARVVLGLRVAAVALGAMASAAIFAVPVVDVALVHGAWRSLAVLPALLGAGLLTGGVGLIVTMGLFAWLGPRRTRLAAQIVATFIGGGFMIYLQIRRFLPEGPGPEAWPGWVETLRLLPMRAAAGEGMAMLEWLGGSLGLFAVAVLWAGHSFAAAVAAAATIPALPSGPRRAGGRDRSFDTRLMPALRAKEWRLLRRDPWLVSQLLLQVLYMTPMLVMLMNGAGPGHAMTLALAPLVVVVCYQVSASMTWLSLSAEDAPDLLATAPVGTAALRLGKLRAVATLAALLAALPLLWLAVLSLRAALITAGLAGLGVCIAMLLSLWHTRPARRASFAARHRESKLLALMEMVVSMLLGVTTALAVEGSLAALVPLVLAGGVLAINRPRRVTGTPRDAFHEAARRPFGPKAPAA